MIRKLRSQKGFSLVEALVAVAILAIFASMAVVGTSGLFGTGEQMMTVSKAAVLGSDVMQIIMNELRYGEEFSLDGTTVQMEYSATEKPAFIGGEFPSIRFNSAVYGEKCELVMSEGGEVIDRDDRWGSTPAEVTLKKGLLILERDGQIRLPISTAAYEEVKIQKLTITCGDYKEIKNEKGEVTKYVFQYFNVTLIICAANEETQTLWTNSVKICPLYLESK